jgi:hypothetical protein
MILDKNGAIKKFQVNGPFPHRSKHILQDSKVDVFPEGLVKPTALLLPFLLTIFAFIFLVLLFVNVLADLHVSFHVVILLKSKAISVTGRGCP